MSYNKHPTDKLILRDHLALDRTLLANERTLLAYMRTAIMLFISGITLIKLFEENIAMTTLGYTLLPLSLGVALFGYRRYVTTRKHIHIEDQPDTKSIAGGRRAS